MLLGGKSSGKRAWSGELIQNRDGEIDQYVSDLDDMLDRSWTCW